MPAKYSFSLLLIFVVSVISSSALAQYGQISISIDVDYTESDCYDLTVTKGTDTFYMQTVTNADVYENDEFLIDSLYPGIYLVSLKNCGEVSDEQFESVSTFVDVRSEEIAYKSFYMYQDVYYRDLDAETYQEIVHEREEFQLEFSYFDFRWNPDGNNPKFNFGFAGSGYMWQSFSKHVGAVVGGGAGWDFAQLQIDQQNQANYPDDIKSNYYTYFYAMYDMKIRFTLFNQQEEELRYGNVTLDLGANYHLPLYFARVTRFNIQDKLVNRFIHRFSDVRLYANLGFTHFKVFASYRPFDFINKNLPQFPKYNLGVRLNFHD